MSAVRKKTVGIVYNGVEAGRLLDPYLEKFSYTDSVDESDTISLSVADRNSVWINSWIPQNGDVIVPSITLENWNYEGERVTLACGSFVVDDFSFTGQPVEGSINGVSAPVGSSFKEAENTKTWASATLRLIASEVAGKYGLALVYDVDWEVQIAKMEQSHQTDSDFVRKLCEKYGMGIKVYANRLVIWDYKKYFSKKHVIEITPEKVSKWSFRSSIQGIYTGVRVSYTDPATKKTVDVMVGTEERLYKTTQKADNEADARLIGEAAVMKANRKETTMQITLPANFSLMATNMARFSGFGRMDGDYFVEKVSHSITEKSYSMQANLSRVRAGAG